MSCRSGVPRAAASVPDGKCVRLSRALAPDRRSGFSARRINPRRLVFRQLPMSPVLLATLALVGFCAGFVDAIAGGGGLVTVPSLALAGLDPVAVIATNKLASTFGSGSSTLAFARTGKI